MDFELFVSLSKAYEGNAFSRILRFRFFSSNPLLKGFHLRVRLYLTFSNIISVKTLKKRFPSEYSITVEIARA